MVLDYCLLLLFSGLTEHATICLLLFQSVQVSPPNDAISVDFRPLKLQPDGTRQYTVAQITFRGE